MQDCHRPTLNFGVGRLFSGTDLDQLETGRRLAKANEESLKLLRRTKRVSEEYFEKCPSIKVNGDPKGKAAEHLNVFLSKVFGNPLRQLLRGCQTTVLTLDKQGRMEDIRVAVYRAEDERVLVLSCTNGW